jgi:hypothetical protein
MFRSAFSWLGQFCSLHYVLVLEGGGAHFDSVRIWNIGLQRRMIDLLKDDEFEIFGRKWLCPNLGTVLIFVWKDWAILRKTSVRIANFPAEIGTELLLNSSLQPYGCTYQFGAVMTYGYGIRGYDDKAKKNGNRSRAEMYWKSERRQDGDWETYTRVVMMVPGPVLDCRQEKRDSGTWSNMVPAT